MLPIHSSHSFWVKHIVRHVVEAQKVGRHVFSCLSLLLSTTILNDTLCVQNLWLT